MANIGQPETSNDLPFHSCQYCQKMLLRPERRIKIAYETGVKSVWGLDDWNTVLRFGEPSLGLLHLIEGSSRGCSLCALLMDADCWGVTLRKVTAELEDLPGWQIHFEATQHLPDMRPKGLLEISRFLIEHPSLNVQKSRFALAGHWVLYTTNDNTAADYISSRPIRIRASTSDTQKLWRTWLNECLYKHKFCSRESLLSLMPKRLVQLAPDLRIVDTINLQPDSYAALSYCWGGDQRIKTLRSTLASYQDKITVGDLPRTLRDAITTTLSLDINYLWIDAFCIIQDDDEDKASQIALMPYIYQRATVTITASRGKSVEDGFLHARELPKPSFESGVQPVQFHVPFSSKGGSVKMISVRSSDDLELRGPLQGRAWCMQEQALSSRILDFGAFSAQWICPTVIKGRQYRVSEAEDVVISKQSQNLLLTDGWVCGYESGYRTNQSSGEECFQGLRTYYAGLLMEDKTSAIASTATHLEVWTTLREWLLVVENYTDRALSFQQDKLPAISAIAQIFDRGLGGRDYYAGLWLLYPHYELLWFVLYPQDSSPAREDDPYIAPSWSWASATGPIICYIGNMDDHTSMIDLVDARVSLVRDQYRFGHVSGGSLGVKGHLLPAHYARRMSSRNPHGTSGLWFAFGRQSGRYEVLEDRPLQEPEAVPMASVPVFALLVRRVTETRKEWESRRFVFSGLVLNQVRPGAFARIGIFTGGFESLDAYEEDLRGFTSVAEQVLTIV